MVSLYLAAFALAAFANGLLVMFVADLQSDGLAHRLAQPVAVAA